MASLVNKRQQARNERILQDLIKKVPGNDRCADCGTRNPGWASWNLGIFLCLRCASIHRKLGTHISKVKSISMDSWTNDQIDVMRSKGNATVNGYFNPDPSKHPIPINIEDSDSVMERYIRNKYERKMFRRGSTDATGGSSTSSHSSGASVVSFTASTSSNNGLPIPPSSSSSNASFREKDSTSSSSRTSRTVSRLFRTSTPSSSKVTQILGLQLAPYADTQASPQLPPTPPPAKVVFPHGMVKAPPSVVYEDQLKSLKEMGFEDDRKNLEVIQCTNGHILQAVEILAKEAKESEAATRQIPKSSSGISVHKTGSSNNPFDALDQEQKPPKSAPQPQTQPVLANVAGTANGLAAPPATNGSYGQVANAGYNASMPWYQSPPSAQVNGNGVMRGQYQQAPAPQVNGFMQDTGGMQMQSRQQQQLQQSNPYGTAFGMNQQQTQVSPTSTAGYNPFLTNTGTSQNPYLPVTQQTNPYQSSMQSVASLQTGNPYFQQQQIQAQQQLQQSDLQQQMFQQQPQQMHQNELQQQQLFQQQSQQPQQQQQISAPWPPTAFQTSTPQQNPYQLQPQPQMQSYPQPQQPQAQIQSYQQLQTQPIVPQRTGIDKSAILALYNYPHLAPQPPPQQISVSDSTPPVPKIPENLQGRYGNGSTDRAVSDPQQPVAGSNNPFLTNGGDAGGNGGGGMNGTMTVGRAMGEAMGKGHGKEESVDLGQWQSGRHSPDAFASLAFRVGG